MTDMKRLLSLFVLCAFLTGPLVAQDLPADAPVLRWAAAPDSNAPYSFYDASNKLTGFEYEIILAVARKMGRKPEFIQNDWDGLIPGLGRGMYDCVICGIEINPDKAGEVDFSMPYFITFEQLVLRKGSPDVTKLSELSGKAIGTLDQTAALKMLQSTPGVDARTYQQEMNAYRDVESGRIYGVLLDYPIAMFYASPMKDLAFVGPPFGMISYGIVVKKGNTALLDEINKALKEVIDSGELRDILSRWNLWTPTMAKALNQPVDPSLPPTQYLAFIGAATQSPTLLQRLERYATYTPLLIDAAILTLKVSILGMALAIVVGFTFAVFRVYGPWPLRMLATLYIEIIRGTPLLIQLLIIYYGLPNIGIKLDPFIAGVLGLGLNYAAYEAENYRGGLMAIPKGQMEGARALGLTHTQGLRHVVIPQAFRMVLPPVTNDFISLLKDSSLVSMVTLVDLTGAYNRMATGTFDYFGTGLLVAAIYLLIGLPFVRLARYTERTLAVDQRRPTQKPGAFHFPAIGKKAS